LWLLQVDGGCLGRLRRRRTRRDCENPGGGVKQPLIPGCPNGETRRGKTATRRTMQNDTQNYAEIFRVIPRFSSAWFSERTRGSKTFQYPEENKTIVYSLSSGE